MYFVLASILLFLTMLYAEFVNFGYLTTTVLVFHLNLAVFFLVLSATISIFFNNRYIPISTLTSFICAVAMITIPVVTIVYCLNFNQPFTEIEIYAILQSNIEESSGFIGEFISLSLVVPAVFLVLSLLLILTAAPRSTSGINRSHLKVLLPLCIASLFGVVYSVEGSRLYSLTTDSIRKYFVEVDNFKQLQNKISLNIESVLASKKHNGELYVIVIGESLSKLHMGIYGYSRNTTPKLHGLSSKSGYIQFDNAFSVHTHTSQVLTKSLTEANTLNGKHYFDSATIIDVLNRADFQTSWITNQVVYGQWDNPVSVIAHGADKLIALNSAIGKETRTQYLDAAVLGPLKEILDEDTSENRAIFIHLMGNHTNYCARFPVSDPLPFDGPLPNRLFGNMKGFAADDLIINCYDNSVAYGDAVVAKIIELLEIHSDVAGFLYFADHADDVIRRRGHNSSKFTFAMTQIPAIAWFSPEYIERYPEQFNTLSTNRSRIFPNDLIHDTVIGALSIETNRYESHYDLTSNDYSVTPQQATTLSGKIPYTHPRNRFWWQKHNARTLASIGQNNRVFPHRVNSNGKLGEVLYAGFNAFEIDTFFSAKHDALIAGHDPATVSGFLVDYFNDANLSGVSKIWLDTKKLTPDNSELILRDLTSLDRQFNLKSRVIVESGTKDPVFSKFRESGWHTSYYLPTRDILDILGTKDLEKLNKTARNIAKQVSLQQSAAVSFDVRLYGFVKTHLEPYLQDATIYHLWDLSLRTSDPGFIQALQKKPYFKDGQVESILVRFHSDFNI